MTKTNQGNFFESFEIGQTFKHATPRTVTAGDVALYNAIYGPRFALQSSDEFARQLGYARAPVDDLLVFHMVFGKTVPDISLNAVANLGYAQCRFLEPVYPGDTLRSESEVIGLRQNSNGKSGIVYVRSRGFNQKDATVLDYVRWVMVRKGNLDAPAPEATIPELDAAVAADQLATEIPAIDIDALDTELSGSPHRWSDYRQGEILHHGEATTVEEAEHQMATRLYQNTARVHFNLYAQKKSGFPGRLIYGGHIISLARAQTFDGLGNAFHMAAINGGQHVAPTYAGDTVSSVSVILKSEDLPGRSDFGALRVRTMAVKDDGLEDSFKDLEELRQRNSVLLDLDCWVLIPK